MYERLAKGHGEKGRELSYLKWEGPIFYIETVVEQYAFIQINKSNDNNVG